MPAFREELNLAATVEDFLATPEALDIPHCVIIVDDGSPDRTGLVADQLAASHPGRVLVVHHEVNKGYGAAVATGIRTALHRTWYRWLFLTDSDGQFRSADLEMFLDAAHRERADAVIGYRRQRADPVHRKINAFLWTRLSRLLLPISGRDIDCAYKLIDRRMLDGIDLHGDSATISPEILVTLKLRGARVIERPVAHFPRAHGEQTGAKLSVILRSMLGLLGLSWSTMGRRWPGRLARRLVRPEDGVLAGVTLAASAASIGVYAYVLRMHAALAYPDAISHLLIARRVLVSSTPGLAQLGAVWLPLPHLLSLPFVWVASWYQSGFAAAVVSMTAYVVAVRYVYRISATITGSRSCALVSAVVLGGNPNVLYMQTTGMTELLLIACVTASAYYLTSWSRTGRYIELAAAAMAALLACLTRYEGWVYCVAALAAIGYVSWRGSSLAVADSEGQGMMPPAAGPTSLLTRYHRLEADLTFFAVIAVSAIAGWVVWNAVIFHSPIYFQTGPFAKPSLWVSLSDPNIGHLGTAAKTYLYAMADNAGVAGVAAAGIGLVLYLVRTRFAATSAPPLTLTIFAPFYIYALYTGQRPLHVAQVEHDLYNVRFGLLMVVPVAVFIGYLASAVPLSKRAWLRRACYGGALIVAAACVGLVMRGGVATYREAKVFQTSPTQRTLLSVGRWLREHYTGGRVLMESFGNETVTFTSQIPLSRVIYEGSFRQWQPALADPASSRIAWILMRSTPGDQDQVYLHLHRSARLRGYRLVYQRGGDLIYERRAPAQPASLLPVRIPTTQVRVLPRGIAL